VLVVANVCCFLVIQQPREDRVKPVPDQAIDAGASGTPNESEDIGEVVEATALDCRSGVKLGDGMQLLSAFVKLINDGTNHCCEHGFAGELNVGLGGKRSEAVSRHLEHYFLDGGGSASRKEDASLTFRGKRVKLNASEPNRLTSRADNSLMLVQTADGTGKITWELGHL
jgi:hypothetical protein